MEDTFMKLNDGNKNKGSFGIPEDFQNAQNNFKKQKAQAEEKPKAQPQPEAPAEEEAKEEVISTDTPEAVLEKMGAKFDEEDFQRLIFKGFYETEIPVIKGKLKAKFKTLTSQEYDEIDEIMAEEARDIPMTNDGYRSRMAMWIISYGVTELAGKVLVKPIVDKDTKTPDTKAMAKERRKIFGAMGPAVVNLLIQKHGAITTSLNMIASNPEGNLKNS
jgi:hypothetical protein